MPSAATPSASDRPTTGAHSSPTTPLTRRALRESDTAQGQRSKRRSGFTEMAPVTTSRAARRIAMGAPAKPAAKSRKSIVSQLATATTMLAVAAIAVVTSVPANALLTQEDLDSGQLGTVQARGSQTLTSAGASVAEAVVSRDAYSVSDPAENALASKWNNGVGTFANNASAAIQWPFAVGVPMSSGFGYRPEQPAGAKPFHSGLDFNPGAGAPIQSIADGVVTSVVESDSGLGVHVTIEHTVDGESISSVYAHMQFGSVAVSEGQAVSVGDRVGLVGSTGQSTGPHLHFELHPGGGEAIDPYTWLKAHAG